MYCERVMKNITSSELVTVCKNIWVKLFTKEVRVRQQGHSSLKNGIMKGNHLSKSRDVCYSNGMNSNFSLHNIQHALVSQVTSSI